MSGPLGERSPAQFLEEYWQRKPLLLRAAFPGFVPPIDGDDLAGLACEELAEARLITGSLDSGQWTLRHGPFDEDVFAQLGERDWTLLVQDVEKHHPPLAGLLDAFAFLPAWRLDDIMVSFAAPGGGVGPHVDQYDVFLLQAQGRRRWQIARHFDPAPATGLPLDMLARFKPEQEWVLEPGDMLYLPPGVAHHGVALEAGLTYSIGLRAPSAADLLLAYGEWLAERPDQGGRYTDPGLQAPARAGEVDGAALRRFARLVPGLGEAPGEGAEFLGSFLSRFRLAHEPAPPPRAIRPQTLRRRLDAGQELRRHPWTRLCWIREADHALLFTAGQPRRCAIELATALCGTQPAALRGLRLDEAALECLTALVNGGHLLLGARSSSR